MLYTRSASRAHTAGDPGPRSPVQDWAVSFALVLAATVQHTTHAANSTAHQSRRTTSAQAGRTAANEAPHGVADARQNTAQAGRAATSEETRRTGAGRSAPRITGGDVRTSGIDRRAGS